MTPCEVLIQRRFIRRDKLDESFGTGNEQGMHMPEWDIRAFLASHVVEARDLQILTAPMT